MDTHHEVVAYVACPDTQRVVDALVSLGEPAGLRRLPEMPLPVLAAPPSRDGLTMFAVLPGAPGWQVVLPLAEAFLCQPASAGGRPRFVALCDALGVPGLFREVNAGSESASAFEASGQVTLACDGRGRHALSGYMWRASQDGEGDGEKAYLQWHGHALEEANMQTTDLALVAPAFPTDWIEDSEALVCDIAEAVTCGRLAQRLGGPATGRHWCEGWPWRLVEDAVRLGDAMPVPGGVIVSFVPVGVGSTIRGEVSAERPVDDPMDDLARRAARGDADAQCEVGLIHRKLPPGPPCLDARDIGQRQLRAATWFRRAAEQGHAAARFWLGRAHYLNEGALQDWSEALLWWERAAAQGQRDALAWLVEPVGGTLPRLELMRHTLGLAHRAADVEALKARLAESGNS